VQAQNPKGPGSLRGNDAYPVFSAIEPFLLCGGFNNHKSSFVAPLALCAGIFFGAWILVLGSFF